MFYVKSKINEDVELKVTLYDDEIFTTCSECGKEIEADNGLLISILQDGDLASSSIICTDCTQKRGVTR